MKTLTCLLSVLSLLIPVWGADAFRVEDMQRLSRVGGPACHRMGNGSPSQ